MKKASDSKAYRAFINDRNRALERIHLRAQTELNDLLRKAFSRVVEIVAYRFGRLAPESMMTQGSRAQLHAIDLSIDSVFTLISAEMLPVYRRLKTAAYTLSLVGEVQGIGLAGNEELQVSVPRGTAQAQAEETEDDSLDARLQFMLSNIRRDVMEAVERSRVLGETTQEALERVRRALPSYRIIKQPKKPLQRVKEADPLMQAFKTEVGKGEDKFKLVSGFIDDEAWENVLDWYLKDYQPRIRVEGALVDPRSPTLDRELENEQFYSWEGEQLATHEFVSSVRSGQNEAASQAGVVDMVWIAVLDSHTCEDCCEWRDGLSTAEIERKLKGERSDDECRVIVPPAHFNCRCDVAPLLKDMPEVEESNAPEFNEWLNSL
jgi:hypothetical protein